jgi:hypothetical protein
MTTPVGCYELTLICAFQARDEPPSYLQRYESFENPMAGRGAQTSGSHDNDDRSSSNPQFGSALYDFTAGGDDEVPYT